MAKTYEPIATTTASGSSASIDFTSIPSTYTDLIVIAKFQLSGGAGTAWFRLNGDTASNYSDTFLTGNGSSATSTRNSNVSVAYFGDASSTDFQTAIMQFQNYANTTTYKTVLVRANATATGVNAVAALWRKTPEAINQITISHNAAGQNFISGSTFTLYGVKSA